MADKQVTSEERIVLILDLREQQNDNIRFILKMAGYEVRYVYDEMDAINLLEVLNLSDTSSVLCLLIRCDQNHQRYVGRLRRLAKVGFALPIMLQFPQEQKRSEQSIRSALPENLDLHISFSDNTLQTMIGITGLDQSGESNGKTNISGR